MQKLPKSIIKKYGITKKAWQVFRGSKGGKKKRAKSAAPKKHVRHARPKRRRKSHTGLPARSHGGNRMARVKHRIKRHARRFKAGMESRPGKVIMMAAEGAAGAVISSLAVNKIPGVSGLQQPAKAGVQAALGLAAVAFIRNRHAKAMGAGAVLAAILSLVKSTMKVDVLAGPATRVLTPTELSRLTGGMMNMPFQGSMGVPLASAPGNAGFKGGFGS